MEQLYTATFCSAFFSVLFVLAILIRQQNVDVLVKPNSALPKSLQFFSVSTLAPWLANGTKVQRDKIKCKNALCTSVAYIIQLPVLENPERPNGWDSVSNAWSLTERDFVTGDPLRYPFATVVKVPKNTPDHVRFVLPQLRPANENELNVTGPYENSFVLFNTSKNDLLFFRSQRSYWTLKPDSKTLLWPANTSPSDLWNAYTLNADITEESAANYAELVMYSRAN